MAYLISATHISIDTVSETQIRGWPDQAFDHFISHWERLARKVGGYPARGDIDALELGIELLPNIFLIDVVAKAFSSTPRFRFRLLGDAILQRERTRPGQYLDGLGSTNDLTAIREHYEDCLSGKVSLRRSNLGWEADDRRFMEYSTIVLPLSGDARSVDTLIGLVVYDI
ncbi:MAG TPA: hypothetical protein VM659_11810 [Dongiaceae bacterium]|nr:hypothetical protein [Dongiaceae bacterium]